MLAALKSWKLIAAGIGVVAFLILAWQLSSTKKALAEAHESIGQFQRNEEVLHRDISERDALLQQAEKTILEQQRRAQETQRILSARDDERRLLAERLSGQRAEIERLKQIDPEIHDYLGEPIPRDILGVLCQEGACAEAVTASAQPTEDRP